MQTGMFKLNT